MQNKNYLKVIVCLTAFMLAGSFTFAAKKKTPPAPVMPEWVSTPTSVYPSSAYFNYVGYGADRNAAEVQAVSGLASIFGQSVKSESKASQRMEKAKVDGKVANASIQSFSQNVLKSVDVRNLVGVELKEFWFDGNATWYAIAVLDKSKTADIYVDMIKKNAKAVHELLENSKNDLYSIEAYSSYDFAQDIALESEDHLRKISVIDPSKVDSLKSYVPSSKKLAADKLDIAKNIPVAAIILGDEEGKIAAAFAECLGADGFRGSLDPSVRYVITGKILYEESKASDGKTTRCRYSLESFLLDTTTDQKLVPFNVTGREGHVDYAEAKNRAEKAVIKKISKDFKTSWNDYLKNFAAQ